MSKPPLAPVKHHAPVPVVVEAPHPLPVMLHGADGKPAPVAPTETLPPTTTAAEDKVTAGQRHINRLWEYTQSFISILVVLSTMGASIYGYVVGNQREIPTMLATAFGSVVTFYFVRTNHTQTGGVGKKADHEGR